MMIKIIISLIIVIILSTFNHTQWNSCRLDYRVILTQTAGVDDVNTYANVNITWLWARFKQLNGFVWSGYTDCAGHGISWQKLRLISAGHGTCWACSLSTQAPFPDTAQTLFVHEVNGRKTASCTDKARWLDAHSLEWVVRYMRVGNSRTLLFPAVPRASGSISSCLSLKW